MIKKRIGKILKKGASKLSKNEIDKYSAEAI